MRKLTHEKGRYYAGDIEVTPVLVYGPVTHSHYKNSKAPVQQIVRIKRNQGVDLDTMANSFISVTIHENEKSMTEIVSFFYSVPKI